MIIGNLKTIDKELKFYPRGIRKGLEFLITQPLVDLEVGKVYPIEGDKIFAKVSEYETEEKKLRRAERHEKFIDIQCIAAGAEKIGTGRIENTGSISEDNLIQNDAVKYKDMQDDLFVTLYAGTFAIYFPWDVHRANCNPAHTSVKVKKVLVKVSMDTLG